MQDFGSNNAFDKWLESFAVIEETHLVAGSPSQVPVEIEVDEWKWDKLLVSNAAALEIQTRERFITTYSRRVLSWGC